MNYFSKSFLTLGVFASPYGYYSFQDAKVKNEPIFVEQQVKMEEEKYKNKSDFKINGSEKKDDKKNNKKKDAFVPDPIIDNVEIRFYFFFLSGFIFALIYHIFNLMKRKIMINFFDPENNNEYKAKIKLMKRMFLVINAFSFLAQIFLLAFFSSSKYGVHSCWNNFFRFFSFYYLVEESWFGLMYLLFFFIIFFIPNIVLELICFLIDVIKYSQVQV